MAYQSVFRRYELKYILTSEQKTRLLQCMQPHMALDRYGRTTIRNIYFDTDNYRLIRRSMERPVYKEKLRLRSYRQAEPDGPVFVELKKKFDGVVYKRRLCLPEQTAMEWLCGGQKGGTGQICQEVDYFLDFYENLHPAVFLSYEREAYFSEEDPGFRVTFDENILCRQDDLSLTAPVGGTAILPEGQILMEVKCTGAMPLWLVHFLSENEIRKTSFSKYGTAYQNLIFPKFKEELIHA